MDNLDQQKPFDSQEAAPMESQPETLPSQESRDERAADQSEPAVQSPPEMTPQITTEESPVEIHQKVEHIAPLPKEEQLWQLKLIARDGSLEKAIAIAKKLNDPWLIDKFHDDLRDDPELRAQLEAMGKLEKL